MKVVGNFPEISFQYCQLCNLITKIQRKSNPFRLLTEFEILCPSKSRLLKVCYMLLSTMTVTGTGRLNWEQDLQEDISVKSWEQINWFGHIFSRNVALQEAWCKICHLWYLIPSRVAKWFPTLESVLEM